jgi:hypothetical protein
MPAAFKIAFQFEFCVEGGVVRSSIGMGRMENGPFSVVVVVQENGSKRAQNKVFIPK